MAAPMVSRGGVYSWLADATPILRAEGWTVGVLWGARVEAEAPAADWERRLVEPAGRLGRTRALRRGVRAAVADFRPDRVLSLLPQSDLACARVLDGGRAPWTAMVHGRPYPAAGEGGAARRVAWRASVRWAYRRADAVVTVSDALGAALRAELGVAGVQTVHNGVALPAGPPRPRGGRNVAFLGRLSVEKAPDLFVAAVRDVDCRARIYGDGPLAASVRAAAQGLAHVTLEGWSERDAALEATDLLVLCSRREALPLACIEAGAQGVPVLARDVGGVREVLRDAELREHCLLPADAPPQAFAERLARLLDDVALRQRLGERLRDGVARDFALPGQVQQLARLLERTPPRSATVLRQRR